MDVGVDLFERLVPEFVRIFKDKYHGQRPQKLKKDPPLNTRGAAIVKPVWGSHALWYSSAQVRLSPAAVVSYRYSILQDYGARQNETSNHLLAAEKTDWLWNVCFFISYLPWVTSHIHMTWHNAKCTTWIKTQSEPTSALLDTEFYLG